MKGLEVTRSALKCIALSLLCAMLLGLTVLVWRLPKMINQQADAMRTSLIAEVSIAESDASRRLADAIAEVHAATAAADQRTGEALGIIRSTASRADEQISAMRADIDSELTGLNDSTAMFARAYSALPGDLDKRLGETNRTLAETMKPVRETAQQIDDAAPLFLDCDHNPDCLFNRYQGVSKSLEQVGGSSEAIAGDVRREADQLTKPQSFWGALRSWTLTLARIWGAL